MAEKNNNKTSVVIHYSVEEYEKFMELKRALGLCADTEVIRFAINQAYLKMVKAEA